MHSIDLKPLSIESLAALRDDVISLLAEKAAAKQRELESEIARVPALNCGNAAPTAKPKAVVKYRAASGETWSGRGSKPKWVEDHLAAGGTLEELKA